MLNPLKKILASAAGMGTPLKKALGKSGKAAAIVSAAALAGKFGHMMFRKIGAAVNKSVAEGKLNALGEIRKSLNKSLEKFIFECVLRWVLYILLILLAYITARAFSLRKDGLVALVILGIYVFYAVKAVRILRWYVFFCGENGWILNPLRLIRAYLRNAVLANLERRIKGLPLHERLAMDFFGPANEKLASDITESSLESAELRREALARLGMWACGWLVYILAYEKFFLLVTGLDFSAFYQPLVWPFLTIYKMLAA